jgi:hypothetical protein
MDNTVVETTGGKLRGTEYNGICAFKGIPYGAPTGGQMRFMPPAKPAPWTGVREASRFGHQSPQNMRYADVLALPYFIGFLNPSHVAASNLLFIHSILIGSIHHRPQVFDASSIDAGASTQNVSASTCAVPDQTAAIIFHLLGCAGHQY